MSSRRPRRSRIYDSNYNMSENYYKSAIDRLDEKYSTRPSSILLRHSEPPVVSPTLPRFPMNLAAEAELEDDLDYARDRASRAIKKETVLDQRSARRGLDLESSFDGQVSDPLIFPKSLTKLQKKYYETSNAITLILTSRSSILLLSRKNQE